MSETTTDAATQDPGVVDPITQPEEQPAEAVITTPSEPTSTDTSEEEEPATPAEPVEPADTSTEEDLTEWATKKGIDLSTPDGQAKALKSMREAEKAFHNKSQQASELAKQINQAAADDPDATEAQKALAIATKLQNAETIRQWKAENNVTPEEDQAMGAYAQANPQAAELLTNGLLTLDQFKAMSVPAKPVDTAAIKKEGGQEALQTLANKQRAVSVTGNATTSPSKSASGNSIDELKERLSGVKF